MCICINCRHVHNCTTYKIIQKQHRQSTYQSKIMFVPGDTLIDINISQSMNSIKLDWDLVECSSFVEQPGKWLLNNYNIIKKQ